MSAVITDIVILENEIAPISSCKRHHQRRNDVVSVVDTTNSNLTNAEVGSPIHFDAI